MVRQSEDYASLQLFEATARLLIWTGSCLNDLPPLTHLQLPLDLAAGIRSQREVNPWRLETC